MIGFADFATLGRRQRRRPRFRVPLPPASWMLAASILVAALVGMKALLMPQRFPVRGIQITGDFTRVQRAAVLDAVSPLTHGNFFSLALGPVRAAVASVPWVDQVSVSRGWPYKLVVHFTVQQPLARWQRGGWVNARGQAIRLGGHMLPVGLPVFSGPPDSVSRVYRRFEIWSPMLTQAQLQVAALQLSPRGGWRIRTTDGSLIVLGRQERTARLRRYLALLATIQKTHPQQRPARVDLRYENGFAVAWTPVANPKQRTRND